MTLEILNQRETFDQLVKKGYKVIKLNKDLTPMDIGFNKLNFVYETEYKENQNYGVVGGSTHKTKDGTTGKLLLTDFDVKEKYLDKDGKKCVRTIPEAVAKLKDTSSIVCDRDYYFALTRTNGLHMGILTNENIPQGVSLYEHQDCEKLRIDTRTEAGYVVAIAPNYQITNIPEIFDRVIPNFEQFMLSLSFIPSNEISNAGGHLGSLSPEYKRKARDVLDTLDVKRFPELGTEKVATHDFISFSVMSCRSRNISLDETTEKIMCILDQIDTSKNNIKTERDIQKLYNKEYSNFEPTAIPIEKETELKTCKANHNDVRDFILKRHKFLTINDKNRELYRYQDGVYVPDDSTVDAEIESNFQTKSTKSFRSEVLEKIKIKSLVDREEIDANDNIKNLRNGLFDLDQGILLEHTNEYKSRIQWNVKYNKNAKCPRFFKFLNMVILDNKERYTALELMALALWSKNRLEKSGVLLGGGGNGKGAFRDIIVKMVGEKHTSKLTLEDYEDKFAPADLDGCIVNIPDEISDKTINKTDKWKSATSHKSIRSQKKFGQPFDFIPYVLNIFSCNKPPQIDDKSDGTYRRIVPIHFDQKFAFKLNDELKDQGVKLVDEDFTNSLLEEDEISGIFNVLVTVLKHLKKRKRLAFELTVEEVRREWEVLTDPYVEFIGTKLDVDSEGVDLKTNYYRKYTKFCAEKGYRIDGINTFYAKFMRMGAKETRNRLTPNGSRLHCFTGFWYKDTPKVSQVNKELSVF